MVEIEQKDCKRHYETIFGLYTLGSLYGKYNNNCYDKILLIIFKFFFNFLLDEIKKFLKAYRFALNCLFFFFRNYALKHAIASIDHIFHVGL